MSAPPAALSIRQALAPMDRLALELLAVAEGSVPIAALSNALASTLPVRERKQWTAASTRKALMSFAQLDCASSSSHPMLQPEAREVVVRALLHEGLYEQRAALLAQHQPLMSFHIYTFGSEAPPPVLRELRRRLYGAANDDAWRELYRAAPNTPLESWLTSPLEVEVLQRLHGAAAVAAWMAVVTWRHRTLPDDSPILALLEAAVERTDSPHLRRVLVHERVLSGDLDAARRDAAHAGERADEGVALLRLALGDVKGADKVAGSWLADLRRAYDSNVLPGGVVGILLPVIFLLRDTATRRKQAVRLLDIARGALQGSPHPWLGAWQALRPLLEPEQSSAHRGPPATHPLGVLVEALAAAWTEAPPLPRARIEAARAQARAAGYLWIDAELAAATDQPWEALPGHVPLVNHRRPAPRWSRVLDLLEAQAPTASTVTRPDRVAWFVQAHPFHINPRLQTGKRDGWTEGKALSLARVAKGLVDVPCATEADLRVAAHLVAEAGGWGGASKWYRWREEAWTALAGHPAVFDEATGLPLTVVARPPRLVVRAVEGGLQVEIHPRPTAAVVVVPVGTHGYEVTTFDKKQLDLANLVGAGLTVPRDGAARLEAVTARLDGLFEVGDDAAAHIAEQSGDPTVIALLAREGDGLSCQLMVQPAGAEGAHLTPGRGSELILARTANGPVRVRRDLAAERAACDAAEAALPALAAAGWAEDAWHLPTLVDALELLDQLAAVRERVRIAWRAGEPLRLRAAKSGGFSLRVEEEDGWFHARGELAVDEGEVLELGRLLRMLHGRRGRFVDLGEEGFLALSADFVRRLEEVERAGRTRGDEVLVHGLAAPVLAPLVEQADAAELAPAWRAQVERMATPPHDPALPAGLEAELRPYQRDGYAWLSRLAGWGVGACLADDMGLGKTVQALALLLARADRGPALVIAPTSVCPGWREQCWRFTPDLVAYDLRSGDRKRILDNVGEGDVVVCSYGLLVTELERLSAVKWATLVLDESQAIKNPDTQRHQAARAIPAAFRVALSGTPVENRLDELWAQMAILNPGLLGSQAHFRSRFARPAAEGDREAMRQLRRLVRPVVLRRTKAEVLDDLPEKTIIDVPVELEGEEAAVYEAVRRQAEEATGALAEGARFELLAWLTRLRLAACHPQLALEEAAAAGTSAKLRALDDIVDSLVEGEHRALVFSQFTRHLDLVQAHLVARGVAVQRLDGSTPAAERERRVAAFQRGEGLVFLISLRAGGFGLNLTGADYVVHLDPWWNPAVEAQASDRAHRIGQTRPVTIYRLYAQGTVEERILALQHDKRAVAEALMEGADAAVGLGLDELRGLLLGA